jgi:hypothetical protein
LEKELSRRSRIELVEETVDSSLSESSEELAEGDELLDVLVGVLVGTHLGGTVDAEHVRLNTKAGISRVSLSRACKGCELTMRIE